METKYTVDYFLEKFEAIPESAWCTEVLDDLRGRHCAFGHCRVTHADEPTVEGEALVLLFGHRDMLFSVNDGGDPRYQQPTPKQRILAALRDIKAKQDAENDKKYMAMIDDIAEVMRPIVQKEIHYVKLEVELTEANPN